MISGMLIKLFGKKSVNMMISCVEYNCYSPIRVFFRVMFVYKYFI